MYAPTAEGKCARARSPRTSIRLHGVRAMSRGGIVEGEPVRLSKTPVLGGVYAPARYCESCRVVIVPVPEIETFADKAGKWLDKTLGSLGDRIDLAAERREEEKAAREREEKRNKDPWEV